MGRGEKRMRGKRAGISRIRPGTSTHASMAGADTQKRARGDGGERQTEGGAKLS